MSPPIVARSLQDTLFLVAPLLAANPSLTSSARPCEPDSVVRAIENPAPYEVLLQRLMDNQPVDTTELRFAFSQSAEYSPYGNQVDDIVRDAFSLMENGRAEEALSKSMQAIGMCFVCGDAYLAAFEACMMLGNTESAREHAGAMFALKESICPSEESGTESCPCRVISTSEEHYYVRMLRHQITRQELIFTKQGPMDRLAVLNPETGETYDLYFDVSIPWGWLKARLESAERARAARDSTGKAPE